MKQALASTPRTTGPVQLQPLVQAFLPILLALLVGALLLLLLERDPLAFYGDILKRGLLSSLGLQESITRSAPLLLLAASLIVAFRAGLWNLGVDGQFLLAAVFTAALAPELTAQLPRGLSLFLCMFLAMAVGALWSALPALLRANYGINEIITTLMTNFLGISLANLLIKLAFRDPGTTVPQTLTLAAEERLPKLFGTSIHLGLLIALVVLLLVQLLMTRSAFGLRLRIMGASPRAAIHAGLPVKRLTLAAFGLSAALAGLGGAVEILGIWGNVRADWNPAYGLLVIPLIFLARLNGLAVIFFIFFFAVISIGGETAARRADLPNYFLPLLMGLVLLFMALTEWLGQAWRRKRESCA